MRALIQKVRKASVIVNEELICSIQNGLCVFVGMSKGDTSNDVDDLVNHIVNLKVFDDDSGQKWNASVKDKNFEILCVSQFTLYAEFKGNVPNLNKAMNNKESEALFGEVLNKLKTQHSPGFIKDGKFGVYRQVLIENDGPVTISFDTKND